MTSPWTEREMKRALLFAYHDRFAVLTEVCAYDPASRRIDVLLFHVKERRAIEIKVSRADLMSDVEHPEKQAPWRELVHKHYYAVPETMESVALGAVPPASGLILVTREGAGRWGVRVRRHPSVVNREPMGLPAKTVQALLYRLAPLEAEKKGLSWVDAASDTLAAGESADLAGRLVRVTQDKEIVERQLAKRLDEIEGWKRRLAAAGAITCAHCGAKIVPNGRAVGKRPRGDVTAEWRHKDSASEELCFTLRRRSSAAKAAQAGGSSTAAPVPDIEPAAA